MEMIRQDMKYLAVGCTALDLAFLSICACLGFFSLSFVVSVLVSSLFSLLNLILLILHLKSSLLKPPQGARRRTMGNYLLRMGILGVLIYLGLTREFFDAFGIILPLIFPKLVLSVRILLQKEGK